GEGIKVEFFSVSDAMGGLLRHGDVAGKERRGCARFGPSGCGHTHFARFDAVACMFHDHATLIKATVGRGEGFVRGDTEIFTTALSGWEGIKRRPQRGDELIIPRRKSGGGSAARESWRSKRDRIGMVGFCRDLRRSGGHGAFLR